MSGTTGVITANAGATTTTGTYPLTMTVYDTNENPAEAKLTITP